MLLKLMVFLGSDRVEAISKIQSNVDSNESIVSVITSESGYSTLVFPYNKKQTWSYLGWALDELSINVEDRDSLEGSYLITVAPNQGLLSKLLSTVSDKSYQLIIKEVGELQTYVIFVDLSEENDKDIINYSVELFNTIASKF
jgi:outer membrane protein assembly factor BamC